MFFRNKKNKKLKKNDTYQDLEPYFLDYIEGKLAPEMHQEIEDFLEHNVEAREEIKDLENTLQSFQAIPMSQPSTSLKNNFYEMLAQEQQAVKSQEKKSVSSIFQNIYLRWLGIAGVLALLVIAGVWAINVLQESPANLAVETNLQSEDEDSTSPETTEKGSTSEETKEINEADVIDNYKENLATLEDTKENLGTINEVLQPQPPMVADVEEDIDIAEESTDVATPPAVIPTTNTIEDITTSKSSVAGIERKKTSYTKNFVKRNKVKSLSEKIKEIQVLDANNDLEMLANIALNDEEENARVLALEILAENESLPQTIQEKLAENLAKQDSPYAQLATLDLIVKYNIKAGNKGIRKLLKSKELNSLVREKAYLAQKIIS